MKIILALCAVVIVLAAGYVIYRATRPEHFGAPFARTPAVELAEVVKSPAGHLGRDIRVQGTITRQCPASGCWFFMEGEGGASVRVELNHLGLVLPQKTGRVAVVEGRLSQTDDGLEIVGNGVEFR